MALQSPALAQEALPDCTGVDAASPPIASQNAVSDATADPGQSVSAITDAGVFTPGSEVEYGVQPPLVVLGTVIAAADGSATTNFVVPAELPSGDYTVFFREAGGDAVTGAICVLPFVVNSPAPVAPAAPAARPAALPFTGSDAFVPLTLGGGALIVVGAGLVLVTRRRRREAATPTSLA